MKDLIQFISGKQIKDIAADGLVTVNLENGCGNRVADGDDPMPSVKTIPRFT